MSAVTKREQSEMPKFQYKLNENHQGPPFASLNGINLAMTWKTFSSLQAKLEKHVRTHNNPKGTVDYQVINPIFDSELRDQTVNFDTERVIYTRKELTTFSRPELTKICNDWLVNPVKKRSEFLIDQLINIQAEYEEYQKGRVEKEIEEDVIFVAPTPEIEVAIDKVMVLEKEKKIIEESIKDIDEELEEDAILVGSEIMGSSDSVYNVFEGKGTLKDQLETIFKKKGGK